MRKNLPIALIVFCSTAFAQKNFPLPYGFLTEASVKKHEAQLKNFPNLKAENGIVRKMYSALKEAKKATAFFASDSGTCSGSFIKGVDQKVYFLSGMHCFGSWTVEGPRREFNGLTSDDKPMGLKIEDVIDYSKDYAKNDYIVFYNPAWSSFANVALSPATLDEGDTVAVVGTPTYNYPSADYHRTGKIDHTYVSLGTMPVVDRGYALTTATALPGMSGGPVLAFDRYGRLKGVVGVASRNVDTGGFVLQVTKDAIDFQYHASTEFLNSLTTHYLSRRKMPGIFSKEAYTKTFFALLNYKRPGVTAEMLSIDQRVALDEAWEKEYSGILDRGDRVDYQDLMSLITSSVQGHVVEQDAGFGTAQLAALKALQDLRRSAVHDSESFRQWLEPYLEIMADTKKLKNLDINEVIFPSRLIMSTYGLPGR